MHKAAQASLNTTNNYGQIRPQLLCPLGIYHRGMVRTLTHLSTSSVFINRARIFRCRIMTQHRIKITTANQHSQTRFAQRSKVFCLRAIRLT